MYRTILEFHDSSPVKMKVEIGPGHVRITEGKDRICITLEGLADIGEAVATYLEESSSVTWQPSPPAAETYANPTPEAR